MRAEVAAVHGQLPGTRRAEVVATPRHWSTGSVLLARGLSYFFAGEIFLDKGLNPRPLHCEADSTAAPPGKPSQVFLKKIICNFESGDTFFCGLTMPSCYFFCFLLHCQLLDVRSHAGFCFAGCISRAVSGA